MNITKDDHGSYHGIDSELYTVSFETGELTRFQVITLPVGKNLAHITNTFSSEVLEAVSTLFRNHLLPKEPDLGMLIFMAVPDSISPPFELKTPDGMYLVNKHVRNQYWFDYFVQNGTIYLDGDTLVSRDETIRTYLRFLVENSYIKVLISGNGSKKKVITISQKMGYLKSHFTERKIVLNSHFFLMDLTDMDSFFDLLGEPYGLSAHHGFVEQPPLYQRPAFLCNGADMKVETMGIFDSEVVVDGTKRVHGKNCMMYRRPEHSASPYQEGIDLAIINREIVGYRIGGGVPLPEAGFVLHLSSPEIPQSLQVEYHIPGLSDFGIQVGPAMIKDSICQKSFEELYWDGQGVVYPPTGYPTCWDTGLAARMGIGSRDGKISLVWAEGNKKIIYSPGSDSRGFSLSEFTEAASQIGFKQFVNLDGGGSSQLSLGQKRALRISDRVLETGEVFERPIPSGLVVSI